MVTPWGGRPACPRLLWPATEGGRPNVSFALASWCLGVLVVGPSAPSDSGLPLVAGMTAL
jgi:hypothetical protein